MDIKTLEKGLKCSLTKKELCQIFGISNTTLWRYLKPLEKDINIKNRIFAGQSLEKIIHTIEENLKKRNP